MRVDGKEDTLLYIMYRWTTISYTLRHHLTFVPSPWWEIEDSTQVKGRKNQGRHHRSQHTKRALPRHVGPAHAPYPVRVLAFPTTVSVVIAFVPNGTLPPRNPHRGPPHSANAERDLLNRQRTSSLVVAWRHREERSDPFTTDLCKICFQKTHPFHFHSLTRQQTTTVDYKRLINGLVLTRFASLRQINLFYHVQAKKKPSKNREKIQEYRENPKFCIKQNL